jgi:SAM-dependent methyltransferase
VAEVAAAEAAHAPVPDVRVHVHALVGEDKHSFMADPSLPSRELLQAQADWLADARSRIFRLAEVAQKKSILDLGSGHGIITNELQRRTSGRVFALDRSIDAIRTTVNAVCADALNLPFRHGTLDLVFSQNVLLWIKFPERVIEGVRRILSQYGLWILFEPDYGGMIEYPKEIETAPIWVDVLASSGADPFIGRKLPALLNTAKFKVRCELLQQPGIPHPERFQFLAELPLTGVQRNRLEAARTHSKRVPISEQIAHLPYFVIIAERD